MMVKDIFLFHPENRDFLTGKCSTAGSLWNTATGLCTASLIFLGLVLCGFWMKWDEVRADPRTAFFGGLMLLSIEGCLAALALRSYYRAKLLRDHGRILSGRIISCSGGSDAEGTFGIEIHYAFVNPEGNIVEGKEATDREDLRGQLLPEVGTPLAILYASNKNFALL